MDGNRFDDLTKRLAADTSRRSFLKRTAVSVAALAGLGAASDTHAARRPTPTPKPLTCLYPKVDGGGQCVCPGGTTPCGPDCCPAGASCCDNACCYGNCFGEELCCPTGQLVCDGVCLSPGQCCADTDCGPGLACVGNQCACQPTITCQSAGLSCGPLTDDCGNSLNCGDCPEPQTCGGGGQEGVCGCTSQMSCDGHCGALETECGNTLDCGNPCNEACQVCQNNACVSIEDGTDCSTDCIKSVCVEGACTGQFTIPCPPENAPLTPCQTYECVSGNMGPECVASPANEGAECDFDGPCQTGICRNGECVGTPIECPTCYACTTSTCEPTSGQSCGDGRQCVDGGCYSFPGGGGLVSDEVANGTCATLRCEGFCCTGQNTNVCCGSIDTCFLSGNDGMGWSAFCCAPENMCNGGCCDAGEVCVEGVGCYDPEQVCAGNTVCLQGCCGSTGAAGTGACCSGTQQCNNGQCVEVDAHSCSADDECLAPATCAGLIRVETQPGHFQVIQPGVCCLSAYTTSRHGQTICCSPGTSPSSQESFPCCSYGTGDCPNCTCSSTFVRGWRR